MGRGRTGWIGFDDAALAEARAVNERIEAMLAGGPPPNEVDIAATRRMRAHGGGPFPPPERLPQAEDRVVDGPAGPLRVRLLRPDTVRGVYLYFHGGGWWNGGADQHDGALWEVATGAAMTVVSADYRLAPEHPWPAAVHDATAVAAWCVSHASALGAERVVVAGESCGAHLAVCALLALRDRGLSAAVVGADLRFGIYDLSLTPSVRRWGDRRLLLDRPTIEWFVEAFTPGCSTEERRAPAISPLYADLADLPPARFSVGALDPLLDDSLFMAARWRAAGNVSELAVYPEGIHGFPNLGTRIGATATEHELAFLQELLR